MDGGVLSHFLGARTMGRRGGRGIGICGGGYGEDKTKRIYIGILRFWSIRIYLNGLPWKRFRCVYNPVANRLSQ